MYSDKDEMTICRDCETKKKSESPTGIESWPQSKLLVGRSNHIATRDY